MQHLVILKITRDLQADVNKAADDFDEVLRRSRASLEVKHCSTAP